MPFEVAARVGPYEILSALGAGGMGEVYRAHDTKLGRDVAIKILPHTFLADPQRVARFQREARTLASLNHPNIGGVYGLEEADGMAALVLELVEGPTLADRIAQGPISIEEALPIAKQITEALEAAHEQGIVHRDLKPANIKVRSDGTVKVLDFGLAKATEPVASTPHVSQSPTITTPAMTQAGMILGTAAYMSPEQAKGRAADKRSDLWSFGCVLYEMLTGRRAFTGEDVTDTLAFIITKEPDWSLLPANTPATIRKLLRRCLERDRKRRVADSADARLEIEEALTLPGDTATVPQPVPMPRRRMWAAGSAGLIAGSVATAMVAAAMAYVSRPSAPIVTRLSIAPPATAEFVTGGRTGTSASISPDGKKIAFTARDTAGKVLLWVRAMDSLTAEPLPGTDGAQFPFWSPDSRFIAYSAQNKLLKIAASGGPPQILCAVNGTASGAWNRDGVIVFNQGTSTLFRVSSAGGQPVQLTRLAVGQTSHSFPSFLPDGRHVLFHVAASSKDVDGIYVVSLDTGESKRLLGADSGAIYEHRSEYLLFVRQGTLLAQSFDLKTLTLADEPLPVAEQVESAVYLGVLTFSVSDDGVLAYGVGSGRASLRMVWVDRQGKVSGTVSAEANYRGLDLAPDGTRVVTHRHEGQGGDIWVTELSRGTTARFTFDASLENSSPIWSPDASQIVFGSIRAGKWGLYLKSANGAGAEKRLVESNVSIAPMSWSPDGRSIVYWVNDPNTQYDLWLVPLSGDGKAVPLLHTPFSESHGQVSPDGKWLAYYSNETGQDEVHVRPFPTGAGRWQVSTSGGVFPRWRGDGRELFYMQGRSWDQLMAVDVKSAAQPLRLEPRRHSLTPVTSISHMWRTTTRTLCRPMVKIF